MKVILALLAVVAVASAEFQYTEEWELWKKVLSEANLLTVLSTGV